MSTSDIPNCVDPGFTEVVELGGSDHAILFYPDGTAAFAHTCDRGARGVIRCSPLLQLERGGHVISQREPLTITPSILCGDCGTHGFVVNGAWNGCS